ncbi:MAG: ARPP-1 family domain-containing protein [Desulfomonilaceae bacterium]
MTGQLTDFLSQIQLGAKQNHRNMTLYCLISDSEAPVDFLTLDNALASEAMSITEITESGSVPELKVINKSNHKILLLDGEELVGAKQNRVLNTTILLAPKSETAIPVSCVEQGRWSYRSERFSSQSRSMSAYLRKRKSETVNLNLRQNGNFRSNQSVVWDEIEDKYRRMASEPSPTMAMADLYESYREAAAAYQSSFRPVTNQTGMIVFIDGKIAGIEILYRFSAFRENHAKIVNSYVMDALESVYLNTRNNHQSLRARAANILESARSSLVEVRKSVSLGNDLRLESDKLTGLGLEFENHILQLTVFSSENGASANSLNKMRRASIRRELRRK